MTSRRFQVTFDLEVDILNEKYARWSAEEFVSVFVDVHCSGAAADSYKVHSVVVAEIPISEAVQ